MSEDGTTISIPIASIPELSAAEADGTTGDIRKFLFALLEKINAEWNERAAGDRPAKMRFSKSVGAVNQTTQTIPMAYQITFDVAVTATEVADES